MYIVQYIKKENLLVVTCKKIHVNTATILKIMFQERVSKRSWLQYRYKIVSVKRSLYFLYKYLHLVISILTMSQTVLQSTLFTEHYVAPELVYLPAMIIFFIDKDHG